MKKTFTFLLLFISFSVFSQTNLMINGVIDGPRTGGLPKAFEIYVIDDVTDLSIYGLGVANNGGGSDGQEYTFPAGSANAGDLIWVASEADEFGVFFGSAPDITHSIASVNGDDAFELYMNGVVVDVFGEVCCDGTGSDWEYLDGWVHSYGGRIPSSTFSLAGWSFSGKNALDGETTNATAAIPYPENEATLPVILLDYHVNCIESKVQISWETVLEVKSDYFTLEWKSNNMGFIQIATIKSNSSRNENNVYSFNHESPNKGINYYRLSQVDNDGRRTSYPLKSIYFESNTATFSLLPNQVENRMKVRFDAPVKNGRLQVYNSAGQLVINMQMANGIDVLNMNMADLQSGQYIVKFIHAEGSSTDKFIKL